MKHLRSPRHLIRLWRRRGKPTINLMIGTSRRNKTEAAAAGAHSAFTASGQAVEAQVRKARQHSPLGLPTF